MVSGTADGGDAAGIGARLRELRRAAGLTQDEVAAGRFTKQYVSQIERGATVPSEEALDWIAARLGVEPGQLRTGLSARRDRAPRARARTRGGPARRHHYPEALEVFAPIRRSLPPAAPRELHRAAARGEVWSLVRLGRVTEAAEVLGEAPAVTAGEQAEVAYLTAVCCYTISEIDAAQVEFAKALELLDSSEEPDDRLRLDIHQWRSRCYRRQRDNEAAHEDIERALELCDATGDRRRRAEVHFQASLVAYRLGRWVLSRRYAEIARDLYEQVGDAVTKARVLNNLADFNHLLGNEDVAMAQLHEALAIFEDAGLDAEAGYVLSSLAEICRERGRDRRGGGRCTPGARAARGSRRPRPGGGHGAAHPCPRAARAWLARPGGEPARRGRRELPAGRLGQPPGTVVDDAGRARAPAIERRRRPPASTARPRWRCSRPT